MSAVSDLSSLLANSHAQEFTYEEMETWGRALGAALPRPCIVTLTGDLGAGKTTLARAICSGLGVNDLNVVTSPTFAILHEYSAHDGPIVHADLYRLNKPSELDALGWEEILATARVLIVEWPERSAAPWPARTIAITLTHDPDRPTIRMMSAVTLH